MHERVRPARSSDREALTYLETHARAAVVEQRGGPAWLAESSVLDWAARLADTLVAEIDDVVVGYLVVAVGAERAEIEQVFVEPEGRELGLGEALLGAAIERARAAGCTAIEGWALPGDRATKNLFERNAMVARKLIVSRPL